MFAERLHPRKRALVVLLASLLVTVAVTASRGWPPVTNPTPFEVHAGYYGRGPHDKPFCIVFVHGIFGSRSETWRSGANTFPALLTGDPEFADTVDAFIFEYYSPHLGGAASVTYLADQLRGSLEDARVLQNHRRLVFLGHSLGGLVARKLLLSRRELFDRVSFLYLAATPTSGSELAAMASRISGNPQLRGMLPLEGSDFLQAIQSDWMNSDRAMQIPSYCAFELLPTDGFVVVSQSSATSLCNRPSIPMTFTHVDIVKPVDRDDPRYTRFATTLREAIQTFRSTDAATLADQRRLER